MTRRHRRITGGPQPSAPAGVAVLDDDPPPRTETGRRFTLPERIRRREWREWKLTDWFAVAGVIGPLVTGLVVGGANIVQERAAASEPVCGTQTDATQPGRVGSGYVLVDPDDAAERRPAVARSCNSRDGQNRVARTGPGRYQVHLERLGIDGGTVEITPVGPAIRVCGTSGWGMAAKSADLVVHVVCSDEHGANRDSGFDLRFFQATADTGAMAYLRYEAGPEKAVLPDPNYAFNSFNTEMTVQREGTGAYRVFVQDMQQAVPGAVKVTSYGNAPRICNPMLWHPWQNPGNGKRFLLSEVNCFDTGGRPADSGFVLTYAAQPAAGPHSRVAGALLWANDPHAARYTPALDYQYNSTGRASMIRRHGPGDYVVELSGFNGDSGHTQVSAYAGAANCATSQVDEGADDTARVRVRCWLRGLSADTSFTLLYRA
ncbi:hypothetical protein [Paractinoplanes rishiriensis]|uniref:Uncharacterized protein n=1 Tax=Paractinoplanes rishiriensis TaxID=1050105 RepID=A0A919K930_9ACTN|nr:hypothetical protein [Actinoplanes rishiriensis]GIF01673.1 hypothetical protein Ari01nite_91370 [Actinoplanes rishiriensis]